MDTDLVLHMTEPPSFIPSAPYGPKHFQDP